MDIFAYLTILVFAELVINQEEPDMRLCRLGICVRRKAKGIVCGTLEDIAQNVTSLKSTGQKMTNNWSEKGLLSPL